MSLSRMPTVLMLIWATPQLRSDRERRLRCLIARRPNRRLCLTDDAKTRLLRRSKPHCQPGSDLELMYDTGPFPDAFCVQIISQQSLPDRGLNLKSVFTCTGITDLRTGRCRSTCCSGCYVRSIEPACHPCATSRPMAKMSITRTISRRLKPRWLHKMAQQASVAS
jgi:hypothetical protein